MLYCMCVHDTDIIIMAQWPIGLSGQPITQKVRV